MRKPIACTILVIHGIGPATSTPAEQK